VTTLAARGTYFNNWDLVDAHLLFAPAPPNCGDCRDQVILANLAWLDAHGYAIGREFVVDPDGDGGFAVGLLDEAGLTPVTWAA
jgi:hypothetical protein